MAIWLFSRKSVRISSAQLAVESDAATSPKRSRASRPGPTASHNHHHTTTTTPTPGSSTRKNMRTEPNKLQRRPRNYSFSPTRQDTFPIDATGRSQSAFFRREDGAWNRSPTLYLKRDHSQPFPSRKCSGRRPGDHKREAEIKAMSATKPGMSAHRSSTPKPNIKISRTNQCFSQASKRTSELSLSLPDSMLSSTSGDSDLTSYKVSVFDSLSPRPTLRCASGVKRNPSRSTSAAAPSSSPALLLSGNNAMSEEISHPRKRIDHLADDMDAKALRELMDRDRKRRQRARAHDQIKTSKKIVDRAELHKMEAEAAKKSGSPSPTNVERGVMGRELVGLGLDPVSTIITSSRQRSSPSSDTCETRETQSPLQVFLGTDAIPSVDSNIEKDPVASSRPEAQCGECDETAYTKPPVLRLSVVERLKNRGSKSTLESDKEKLGVADDDYDGRKASDASANKPSRLSLSSLLKWSSRGKRGSGPSSFSNTSREEMQSAAAVQVSQAQAEALARLQGDDVGHKSFDNGRTGSSLSGNYVGSKFGTVSMSKRTRSRFREDLDDFPTPPDSRVQSPDAGSTKANLAGLEDTSSGAQPILIPRSATPITSGQRSVERLRESSLTEGSYNAQSPSPDAPLSMSLASIDSEGSWLSGGTGHRKSGLLREGHLRVSRPTQPSSSSVQTMDEEVELGVTEYECMTRLARHHQLTSCSDARRSEEDRPSSDAEEGDVKWGAVGARPHVVHRVNRSTVHSQQALLNIDSGDEASDVG